MRRELAEAEAQHGRGEHRLVEQLRPALHRQGADAAAHGVAEEIDRQTARGGLDARLGQVLQIQDIVPEAIGVDDVWVIIPAEGAPVPALVEAPDLVACLQHVIDGLRKFGDGLRKAVADDDHALRRVGPVVLEIDGLALDPTVQTGLPSGGQIGLRLGLHELRVVFLRDPMHLDILLSRRIGRSFFPVYQNRLPAATES